MSGTDARWDHLSVAQRYRIYRAQRDLRDAYRDGRMPAREYVLRRDAAMVALAYRLFSRSAAQGPRLEIEDIDQGLFTLKAEVPGGILVIELSTMEMSSIVGDACMFMGTKMVLRDR